MCPLISLEKAIYRWKNRGFTFSLEVKVFPFFDSPMMSYNQPGRLWRDYTDRCEELSCSVYQPPSIFLGVILLGMNKLRLWKCPWTSSKKRKKRSRKENTAMSERNKQKLAESWSYGWGIKPAKDRVESWERRCNDSTCSFWLACLFLSNPTCFSSTYQLNSFCRIYHK